MMNKTLCCVFYIQALSTLGICPGCSHGHICTSTVLITEAGKATIFIGAAPPSFSLPIAACSDFACLH